MTTRFLGIGAMFLSVCVGLGCASFASSAPAGQWDPNAFRNEETLEFLTVGPDEGEHWSRVWLVVIDGQLYVRLGTTAAGRVERNTTAPYVKVRIAGQEFDRVKVEPTPDMAAKVMAAMAEKYWLDIFVRYSSHPLTARLAVEPAKP
jgi:hypothetical protein